MEIIEKVSIKDLKFSKRLSFKQMIELGVFSKCKSKKQQKEQYDKIQGYLNRMIKVNGEMKHIYKYTLSTNWGLGGRLFSGSSIQAISGIIRGFLFRNTTTDIDCANCHPVILRWLCRKHSLPCPHLDYYIHNREEVLSMGDRDERKLKILKMVNDDKVNRGLSGFMKSLDNECKEIQRELCLKDEYKELIKTVPSHKVYNWYGSAINRILCKYENEIIQEVIHVVNTKNIDICALMFDGMMVYGNYNDNKDLLKQIEQRLNEKFEDLNMKMAYKHHDEMIKIPDDWIEPEEVLSKEDWLKQNPLPDGNLTYIELKDKFENEMGVCKVLKGSMFLMQIERIYESNNDLQSKDNITQQVITMMNRTQIKTSFEHLAYLESVKVGKDYNWVSRNFINKWLLDPNIKLYVDVGNYPPPLKCPNHVYNLWEEWDVLKYNEYEEKPEEVQFILEHIKVLCGNDDNSFDYFCKWIAQMLQYPAVKTLCPTIISEEGAGKGTLLKLLRSIMGTKKVIETTNPNRDCWGDFNSMMMSAFLVNLNELSLKDTMYAEGMIKGLITDDTIGIRKLHQDVIHVPSYHRFIITTNNEEGAFRVKRSIGHIRHFIMRASDELCGKIEHFNKMYELLDDKDVIISCYMHFMDETKYDVKDFNKLEVPKTPYQMELEKMNMDAIEQFVKRKAEKKAGLEFEDEDGNKTYKETMAISYLHKKFMIWIKNNNFDYNINVIKFGCRLHRLKAKVNGIYHGGHTRNGNIIILDYKEINKHYLNEEVFDQYYTLNGCQIHLDNTDSDSDSDCN
jgi:hypothetical protein